MKIIFELKTFISKINSSCQNQNVDCFIGKKLTINELKYLANIIMVNFLLWIYEKKMNMEEIKLKLNDEYIFLNFIDVSENPQKN